MSETIQILYQSESLVVVDKPSGLAVHRGWAQDRDYAMTRTRDAIGQYVYPVHRLDRATSGILVFALDKQSATAIQDQFANGQAQKIYLALVRGHVDPQGCIDHPLKKEGQQEAKPASTRFISVGTLGRYAWVLANPLQGRQHQIRRHFKHISRHLIGDVRYGKGEHNRFARQQFGLHRLALHALSIRLQDPSDPRRPLDITCEPTGSLAQTLFQSVSHSELHAHLRRGQALWTP